MKDRDDDDDDDNDGVVERDNEEERAGCKDIEHAKAYWRGDEGHRDDGVKDGGWRVARGRHIASRAGLHHSWQLGCDETTGKMWGAMKNTTTN